jgi:NADH-quinone oxidoreductase subunit L
VCSSDLVGAYGAGIFHLFTHAYFKALLFLCAGSVMHAMSGELDIQKMGGLRKYMPVTFWTFLIASLSIAGVPGLAGFFSKDEILWLAYNGGTVGRIVWVLGSLGAGLTAFYTFRIVYVAFFGDFRGTPEQERHLHEPPASMTVPMIILAVGALSSGWIGISPLFGGSNWIEHFFAPVLGHPHVHGTDLEEWTVVLISAAMALTGILASTICYRWKPELPTLLGEKFTGVYKMLWNKYYIDELYDHMIVRPAYWLATTVLAGFTDATIIEGIVNGIPTLIGRFGDRLRKIQSGYVQHYAISMAIGLFILLAFVLIVAGK